MVQGGLGACMLPFVLSSNRHHRILHQWSGSKLGISSTTTLSIQPSSSIQGSNLYPTVIKSTEMQRIILPLSSTLQTYE